MMRVELVGYYGQHITRDVDAEHTWESIESLYKATCPEWHDGTLVEIARVDKGCAYNAPGAFMARDREGNKIAILLTERSQS